MYVTTGGAAPTCVHVDDVAELIVAAVEKAEAAAYQNVGQCSGVHAGVKTHVGVPARARACPDLSDFVGSFPHMGRFCCSMYWSSTVSDAPPTDPAK